MPRVCLPASRTGLVADGIDLTTRRSFRLPTAIFPIRFRVLYCASQVMEKCGEHEDLAEWTRHHNHGRLTHVQDDAVDVLALLAMAVWHQPMRAPAASHCGLHR